MQKEDKALLLREVSTVRKCMGRILQAGYQRCVLDNVEERRDEQ